MKKQELKELVERTIDDTNELYVKGSFPSIFSKEDVSKLLERLTQELGAKIDTMAKEDDSEGYSQELVDKIKTAVEECVGDHDFDDEVDLEISGREIYVTVESGYLIRKIRESIDEVTEEYKENLVG